MTPGTARVSGRVRERAHTDRPEERLGARDCGISGADVARIAGSVVGAEAERGEVVGGARGRIERTVGVGVVALNEEQLTRCGQGACARIVRPLAQLPA